MALIHECCGHVEYDPTGIFCQGELVVPIPNIPKSIEAGIYENYVKGSKFLSSGYDGFMREYISMPAERVVSLEGVKEPVAAVSEFISVAVHAVTRFEKNLMKTVERLEYGEMGALHIVYQQY
jgi:Threonine dehydrogenase and related Zn-dependent dehydrogenases